MSHFELIAPRPFHCGQLARTLRHEHRTALDAIGVDIHRELSHRYAASSTRIAWAINGRLAALGGVMGTAMAPVGYVWLAASQAVLDHPIAFVREVRRQLDAIMQTKRELATLIVPEDRAALRLATFLGFHVSDTGLGSPATNKSERIALRRYLDAAHDIRIPMGRGRVIPMGYHKEAA